MNGYLRIIMWVILLQPLCVQAQEKPGRWDLKSCIDYALGRNIQIKKSRIALEESQENVKLAKAQLFPSLSFSSGHNLVNRPKSLETDQNTYSGSYNLNSSVVIYNGGKLKNNFQQQELKTQIEELTVKEAENDITLSITTTFLQLLYANEAVKINQNTVEVSEKQLGRSKELLAAGSISKTDLAQIESQYSSDKYQLVVAKTSLDDLKLQLKQLLELGITDEMELIIPELSDSRVMTILPSKSLVYETSLEVMPQIKYNRLSIDVAGLESAKAKAGYLPSLNLSAGIGTGHNTSSDYSFMTQMKNGFNESVGLTLNIPIYSNRSNKSAVKIAALNIENTELSYQSVQKDLLKTVETVYLDAISSQDRFEAAMENLKAVELSFKLTEEQFFLSMKNTLELLTEKNNLLSAQQEVLQSKYMAILNQLLLDFYQGKPIELKA